MEDTDDPARLGEDGSRGPGRVMNETRHWLADHSAWSSNPTIVINHEHEIASFERDGWTVRGPFVLEASELPEEMRVMLLRYGFATRRRDDGALRLIAVEPEGDCAWSPP